MSSDQASPTDDAARRDRLGELLARFHEMRESDPGVGIGALREEAGDLFPELLAVGDCEGLLEYAMSEEDDIPEAFGPYRIVSKLGEGGTGVVYRAHEPDRDRYVALKIVRETLAAETESLERFRREAEVTRKLDHEHIVKVHDQGEIDGRMYLAMEALEGPSLAGLLAEIQHRGGGTPDESWLGVLDARGVPGLTGTEAATPVEAYARRIAGLLAPAARALAAAGEAGLVHRDVKPSNLVLDAHGRLKLTDFGLAKVFGHELTPSVAMIGTPRYLSPEQARGESRQVGPASDVYALGVTLHEALTLALPHEGSTIGETISAIASRPAPPLRKIAPVYPRALGIVVGRCLETDPRDRYADAGALASDLERFSLGQPVRARPVSPLRRLPRLVRRRPVATIASLAAGVLILVLLLPFLDRTGKLKVKSTPSARVTVNGKVLADTTPCSGTLEPGSYEVVLEREGFETLRCPVEIEPGGTYDLDRPLRPVERTDPNAGALLARAVGLPAPPSFGPPLRSRTGGTGKRWLERVAVLSPAGKVSREGLVVRLDLAEPVDGLRVSLEGADGSHWTAFVPEDATDFRRAIPEGVAAALVPGELRLVVSREGDRRILDAPFELTDAPGPAARLARLPAVVRDRVEYRLLVAEALLQEGHLGEAYAMVEEVDETLPERPRPLRLLLEALTRIDEALVDGPLYAGILTRFDVATGD